jgi:penicillin-binding protein 1A
LGQVVGVSNVIATAKALGLKANLQNVLSLPLGVVDVTPLDMAAAYGAFANDGKRAEPYYVDRIDDSSGHIVYQHKAVTTRAVSSQTAREVTKVLAANVQAGTGTRARLGDQPAAGKTGTTTDFTDAWFVGFTPYLATAVWMGNASSPIQMRNLAPTPVFAGGSVTGGTFPAQMWGQFNRAYQEGKPVKQFTPPAAPTRAPRDLRTIEQLLRADPCYGQPLLYDSNADGQPDTCVPPPTTVPPTTVPPTTVGPTTTTRLATTGATTTTAATTTRPTTTR